MNKMTGGLLAGLWCVAALTSACADPVGVKAPTITVSGVWAADFPSVESGVLTLTQKGSTADFVGTFDFGKGIANVSGTLQGNSIDFKIVSDAVCPEGESLTGNGKLSADGATMSGETVVVDCGPPYSGTFTATKTKSVAP